MSTRLRRAYRASGYEAAGAVARIGRRSAALDALLRRMGVRDAAFVSAWNPFSRRMPEGWNARRHARLLAATRRCPRLEGWGGTAAWRERHLLLGGDARRGAVLARRFRQNAIVVLRRGQPARLVVLRPL
ncbi:DUF3293 domain-containing protein [Paracraurococcus ruber]|uniref:DUF3293 domain-containing protein n=1 Tax=Paracraurococcus ruber TaxID=77675 RepID=A0ABS1D8K9_9PROT|nr:DUF3293 domain-containing protein [Paracraurococcus ruber]MBK1662209.1 hypothetical protein [Paracraurococcus ruber]TDG14395.1 DUF3293 domain-containing protein [Paracraurococcus ruber]